MSKAKVILIPVSISDDGTDALPQYIEKHLNECQVFFVENIRTARRAFKKVNKQFDIDSRSWHEIGKNEEELAPIFLKAIKDGQTIGIASESGCPGVADPGHYLIAIAQRNNVDIKPLVGPSSILLTLMASGMNGQHFSFNGYLPIQEAERVKKIKLLESIVMKENCTQLFIETPYRNNQLFQSLLKNLDNHTVLCIGYHITGIDEWIKSKTIAEWKKTGLEIPKQPTMFAIGKL